MRPILFVQPFSLGSAGGGPRILRSLLEEAPRPWKSVCTSPGKSKPWPNESHLRSRPSWGPIEHSRLADLPKASAKFFAPGFRARLKDFCVRNEVCAIHALPHTGGDFAEAHTVARELSLPYFISVHDDLAYTASTPSTSREPAMKEAWNEAAARFVISQAMGEEYNRRYGAQPFEIVTDGLTSLSAPPSGQKLESLRVYFMGLFHMGYERNLRAFLEGLTRFEKDAPPVSLTFRCEHIRPQVFAGLKHVDVLPFADEAQVQRDLTGADLVYLPMPFGEQHENFTRFSLSTKMVTYLGSGVPIFYHGPASSPACELLREHTAAFFCNSLEPEEIARVLSEAISPARIERAANALALARAEFMRVDQAKKFWSAIEKNLAPA